jgi:DNA modification methylase
MSDKIFEKTEAINIFGETVEQEKDGALLEKFLMPPFSVFDTKQGYWQERKALWKTLGIKSEIGRDATCLPSTFDEEKYGKKMQSSGVSIFDPALCEVVYKWFNVDGGTIYDCFAGGSVRGIVAEKLKYKYVGIDLRQEQVDANIENAKELNVNPTWYCDDSMNVDKYLKDESVDLVFSCPPYLDLEVYSDHPNDLSNMEYDQFKVAYIKIIERACAKLKQDRFAVFVVGDVRDKDGFYRNFVDLTKYAFNKAGLKTYNEVILLDMLGTAMIRAGKPFTANRKLTKVHQNVLVFYKGDPKNIRENYKALELDY